MATDRYRHAVEEGRQLLEQRSDALEQRRKHLAKRQVELSKQKVDASREGLANIVKSLPSQCPTMRMTKGHRTSGEDLLR
jgi:hypothetical protein